MGPTELLIFLTFGAGMLGWRMFNGRQRQSDLRDAATSSGLTDITDAALSSFAPGVEGEARGLHVALRSRSSKNERHQWVVEITDPRGGLFGLDLKPESGGTAFEKRLLGAREIETGDEPFDADFFVGGPPVTARALLDGPTRALLREQIKPRARVEIAAGVLRASAASAEVEVIGGLPTLVATLLDLAERLTGPADSHARLARNVREDPLPSVRLQNLLALVRESSGPATRETLVAACGDEDVEVRLRAAAALGGDGVPTLLKIAEDHTLEDVWQAEAVRTLGRRLSPEQAAAILAGARRRVETIIACLHVLGGHGAQGVETLQQVLTTDLNTRVVAAAAKALGATGIAAAERPLLAALEHANVDVSTAAAHALGRVGSAEAVMPLKDVAERSDDRALARAARQAVAEIQSRLGASPGRLSLAAPEGGQVSLADDEAGRLSLPAADAGKLSLPEGEGAQWGKPKTK